MILGLIPARGGSKGIPRKNTKPLGGKPLIQWTIEAGRASGVIKRLVVSTEDAEIKAVAERLGVEVLDRPAELARDDTPMAFVMRHALEACPDIEILVLLQPTSPFRRPLLIDQAVETLQARHASSVVSFAPIPRNQGPEYAWFARNGHMYRGWKNQPTRRQDAQQAYYRDGSVYAFDADQIRKGRDAYSNCIPVYVSRYETFSLDEPEDWAGAERYLVERGVHAEHDQEATALHAC